MLCHFIWKSPCLIILLPQARLSKYHRLKISTCQWMWFWLRLSKAQFSLDLIVTICTISTFQSSWAFGISANLHLSPWVPPCSRAEPSPPVSQPFSPRSPPSLHVWRTRRRWPDQCRNLLLKYSTTHACVGTSLHVDPFLWPNFKKGFRSKEVRKEMTAFVIPMLAPP